jgi:hypothetical protein
LHFFCSLRCNASMFLSTIKLSYELNSISKRIDTPTF